MRKLPPSSVARSARSGPVSPGRGSTSLPRSPRPPARDDRRARAERNDGPAGEGDRADRVPVAALRGGRRGARCRRGRGDRRLRRGRSGGAVVAADVAGARCWWSSPVPWSSVPLSSSCAFGLSTSTTATSWSRPGRVERDVVERRRRLGARRQHEHAWRRVLVGRVAADPRQLLAVLAHLDRRERQQHPRACRGAVNCDGKGAFLVGGEHAAGPLEHGVARAVGRGRRRPPFDVAGGGVGERGADADGDGR